MNAAASIRYPLNIHESAVMKVCDKPGFVSEFLFAFWGGKDGVAEVRDVAIEEVEE